MKAHILEIAHREHAAGLGLLGLWVRWGPELRDNPVLFAPELDGLSNRSRDEVASRIGELWGADGITAVVQRRRDGASPVVDWAKWMVDEIESGMAQGKHEHFAHMASRAPSDGPLVAVVIAQADFPHDGESQFVWTYGGHLRSIGLRDAARELPAGLEQLVQHDSRIQRQLGFLESHLRERWQARVASHTDGGAAEGERFAAALLAASGKTAPPRGGSSRPRIDPQGDDFTSRVVAIASDVARAPDASIPLRLANRGGSILNWLASLADENPGAVAEVMVEYFGEPGTVEGRLESVSSALLAMFHPQELRRARDGNRIGVAMQTLFALRAAQRWTNMFAHRDEYRLNLATGTLDGLLDHEVRHLTRIVSAWRF
jgi:hypothetical protein